MSLVVNSVDGQTFFSDKRGTKLIHQHISNFDIKYGGKMFIRRGYYVEFNSTVYFTCVNAQMLLIHLFTKVAITTLIFSPNYHVCRVTLFMGKPQVDGGSHNS